MKEYKKKPKMMLKKKSFVGPAGRKFKRKKSYAETMKARMNESPKGAIKSLMNVKKKKATY